MQCRNLMLVASLALSGVVLSGCSGNSLDGASTTTSSVANLTGGNTAKKPFDPFTNEFSTTTPKRVVIKNPTRAQIMQTGPLPDIAMGKADAPVTIIKYASLTCPFCRRFQKEVFPTLKRDYIDKGKVRFIIREFPIGRQSGLATVAWRCAGKKDFFRFYEKFMFNQRLWVSQEIRPDPIAKLAAKMGMTRAKFDSCRKNQDMIGGLKWIKDRGRSLGVIGTPNLFINERLVKRRIGLKELRSIIDPMLAG